MTTQLPVNGLDTYPWPEGFTVKSGLARMLKGGVIMDVVNAEQV
jgi:pyridoxal 5'-phosphate synthase pdxS subunit